MNNPVCFIIMPFGKKKYKPRGEEQLVEIDFDEVYTQIIEPAVTQAGMLPVRADREKTRGIIHKPMFERIILSDYVVADVTGANANVYYELGIRHAVKPYTTITIFASNSELPFDLGPVRTIPYQFSEQNIIDKDAVAKNIADGLTDAKQVKTTDSPIYQLVDGISFQNSVAHEKTDLFHDKVKYDTDLKTSLAKARKKQGGKEERINAVDEIANDLTLENEETGVLIDVMLSYRSLSAWHKMIAFINKMPFHVKQTVMVQEQLGFALNRVGERDEAKRVLEKVLAEHGPSSETYGLLGRIYKDEFDEAFKNGNEFLSEAKLDQAIDAYTKGFEADWRDAYPGINAVTLLELKGEREKVMQLTPVVEYAVHRKMAAKKPDYWDHATLLELAVILNDGHKATEQLRKALATNIEGSWMFETTLRNLTMINDRRIMRAEDTSISARLMGLLQKQISAG
ncbi:MAG: TRAFs-binding domain-containing protein [Chitinophagaceae bacterium]